MSNVVSPLPAFGALGSKRIRLLSRQPATLSTEAFSRYIDASSLGFGWRGVGVWRQTVTPMRELMLPPLTTHHVVLMVEGSGRVSQIRPCGEQHGEWTAGDFAFLPRGTASGWSFRGEMTLAHIDFTADFFRNVCLEVCSFDPNRVRFDPGFKARDPELLTLGSWLLREIGEDALDGPVYAESVGVLIAVHVLRAFAIDAKRIASSSGALSKPRLRRVLDHLAVNLTQPGSIETLALLADYSTHHFSRAFKSATGLSPRQYLIQLRTQRARDLIETTALPLAEIAEVVGYEHPAQLVRMFKRETGSSPAQWRRNLSHKINGG